MVIEPLASIAFLAVDHHAQPVAGVEMIGGVVTHRLDRRRRDRGRRRQRIGRARR